jgi:proline iminopeptidase
LTDNTTAHLIADMEALRHNLHIESWHVAGGSWGSTLALAYADAWPDRVASLVLYGIFLCRPTELQDLYFDGGLASKVFPDVFEEYLNLLPPDRRSDPLTGYRDLFLSEDRALRLKAIDLWTRLEKRVSALVVPVAKLDEDMSDPDFVLAHSLVENHYFLHNGFIDGDKLLENLPQKLKGKSIDLIQGRYDMVCPFKTAWEVHKALPESRLHIIDAAGHTAKEPATTSALVEALDRVF